MLRAYKYRIYPTDNQKVLLAKTFGCCRFVYNWALNLKKAAYKEVSQHIKNYNHLHSNVIFVGNKTDIHPRRVPKEEVDDFCKGKFNFDNFDISILEKDIPLDKLDEREQYWMDYYQSYDLNIGYNICSEAGTTRGFKHSEETKRAISQYLKQFYIDHPEKIRYGKDNPVYGKHITPENSKKMSERLIGNQYAKGLFRRTERAAAKA